MGYRRRVYKEALALAHARARINAKLSQEYMAMEMEVNKKTVISWEKGISSPPIDRSFEWFSICGVNPLSEYLKVLWPDAPDVSDMPGDKVDEAWMSVSDMLPESTKRALLFLFTGDHGSSPDALIQMLLAYLHTPLTARATQAITTLNIYNLMSALGKDACPDSVQPDIELFEEAITSARVEILRVTSRRGKE